MASCAITSETCSVRVPLSATTLAGFRAWATSEEFPDRLRASFIEQDILIDMSPEELETHGAVKAEVARVVMNLNREIGLGKFYPDGILVTNPNANLSTEPDGTFVTRKSMQSGRVRLVPREGQPGQYVEIEGTPDWVLEIVSRGSVRKDTRLLRDAYHRAGIPEYWLIDARGQDIHFQILIRREAGYRAAAQRGGWQRSPVFGRSFRLERERDDMGLWHYTLRLKPV